MQLSGRGQTAGGQFKRAICKMGICKNRLYIESRLHKVSVFEIEEDLRYGCLKCSGFNYDCVDRIDIGENGKREKFVRKIVKLK